MDENREDQPLSSEELLRRAREGLGESSIPQDSPADFSIESYPPLESDSTNDFDPSSLDTVEPPITAPPPPAAPFEPSAAEPADTPPWAPPPSDDFGSDDWTAPAPSGPAPEPAQRGSSGRIWIMLAIIGIVGVGVFSLLDSSTTVDDIAVGDCMNVPEDDVFSTVETIDCTEPHDLEVFALVDLSEISSEYSASSPYPGDQVVLEASFDACYGEFERYVGVPYEESVIYMDAFTPTLEGWNEQGDRIANCLLYQVTEEGFDIRKSNSSLRNAGR